MNRIKIFLTTFIIISTITFSQEKFTPEKYKICYDSLSNIKQNLISEKILLEKEITESNEKLKKLETLVSETKYNYFIKKYGKEKGVRIFYGRIWKGMSEDMMLDAWGKPDKKETTKRKWGVFTQYYYGNITYFFKNKILTDWEEKK